MDTDTKWDDISVRKLTPDESIKVDELAKLLLDLKPSEPTPTKRYNMPPLQKGIFKSVPLKARTFSRRTRRTSRRSRTFSHRTSWSNRTLGGNIVDTNALQKVNEAVDARQPNQTLILYFREIDQLAPFQSYTRFHLVDGKRLLLHIYMFTTSQSLKRPIFQFEPLFVSPEPFTKLYNVKEVLQHESMQFGAPDEVIHGVTYRNTNSVDPARALDTLALANLVENAVNVVTDCGTVNVITTDLNVLPNDLVKSKCMTKYWDQIINPRKYLSDADYRTNQRVQHYLTGEGMAKLQRNGCRSMEGEWNIDALIAEVNQKELEYDRIFLNKAKLTNVNNQFVWSGKRYKIVWRVMSQPYNTEDGDYEIQNYLHTTVDKKVAIDFATRSTSRRTIIYCIRLAPCIPYISYDNQPYESNYDDELEILFMRGTIARPVDEIGIHPEISRYTQSQNIMLYPSGEMLQNLCDTHERNTSALFDTRVRQIDNLEQINGIIATDFGADILSTI